MKEFLLIFRNDFSNNPSTRSPEEMQATMKKWMDWLGGVAAQNKLVSRGNSLHGGGKILKSGNVITDGPYVEIKEAVGGYSIIKADSIEEAVELSKGCPILESGGNVEVREIVQM
ncbi:MAG: YciI family protein [Ferruginibacter sp.]